jgi:hypothetical protein
MDRRSVARDNVKGDGMMMLIAAAGAFGSGMLLGFSVILSYKFFQMNLPASGVVILLLAAFGLMATIIFTRLLIEAIHEFAHSVKTYRSVKDGDRDGSSISK